MESVIEELQLLGICDLDDEESKLDKVQIIRSLLTLYYCTFEDKTEMKDTCLSLNSEMRKLMDSKARTDNRFTAQEVLILNLKREKKILEDKLKDTNELLLKTKKEAEKERLKWERWAQLQRVSSSKVLNQLSVVKEELRKKTCSSSSNSRKSLPPVQHSQISMPKSLSLSKEEVLESKTSSNHILEKALQRLDVAHRILVKEGAEVCSSLQLIDASLQESVGSLRSLIDIKLQEDSSSGNIPMESSTCTASWIPLILDSIHQKCLKLSEITTFIQS